MSEYSNTRKHVRIQQHKATTCQNTPTQSNNMSKYSDKEQQHVKIQQHKATCQNTAAQDNNMSKYSNNVRIQQHNQSSPLSLALKKISR